tara:strand:+ start:578 stop:799 length:222 start_codon:yes stop_codon:yes gene_type:complete
MKKALMIIGAILFLLGGIDYIMKLTVSVDTFMTGEICPGAGLFGTSICSGMYSWLHWLLMVIGGGMVGAGRKM